MLLHLCKRDCCLRWLTFLLAVSYVWTFDASFDFEIFDHQTFEVEEGILLEEKIIGHVWLSRTNESEWFRSDEPQFSKPENRKHDPQPQYFEVDFLNVSTPKTATTAPSRMRRSDEEGSGSTGTTAVPLDGIGTSTASKNNGTFTTTTHFTTPVIAHTDNATQTRFSSVGPNTVTMPTGFPFPESIGTVVAQIKQVYDLDREKQDTHYLTINSYDGEGGIQDIPKVVVIKVTDKNDNSPVFVKESLSSQITKKSRMGEIVGEIKATDADIGENADLRYEKLEYSERINNATARPLQPTVAVGSKSGLIFLMNSVDDFDVPTKITFKVTVKDGGGRQSGVNRATATATVSIIDPLAPPPPSPYPEYSTSNADQTSSMTVSDYIVNRWTNTENLPHSAKKPTSGLVIAMSVLGGVLVLGILAFVAFRCRRAKVQRNDGQLEFMLNDENLITG